MPATMHATNEMAKRTWSRVSPAAACSWSSHSMGGMKLWRDCIRRRTILAASWARGHGRWGAAGPVLGLLITPGAGSNGK
jgi:hypothetical protein